MASLTLKGVSKRFGRILALSRVNLRVEDGKFCVLLGPSGCGKSTLLHIVAGLVPQDEGIVMMDDHPVDALPPKHRDIAMVFQSYALYPHMTVAQNLSFGLRMRGTEKSALHERVQETAKLLGIEDLLERKPVELSGGQKQRVAMGRALVRRPKLFLLDEPLSNLDARLRAKVRLELKHLHQQIQGTVLYVTHDQVEAMTLGDTVAVMRDGEVCQIGSPEMIYSRPADTFVATFIGSPEMNLYEGELIFAPEGTYFRGANFTLNLGSAPILSKARRVEVGVRSEDIQLDRTTTPPLTASVDMVSDFGSEKYLHARIGLEKITIRAPKDTTFRPGQTIHLRIEPGSLHIFHQGRRI
jgi:multiple sugar transport system ATP-binding protein